MSEENSERTEHEVQALLWRLPPMVAFHLKRSPVCLWFLRIRAPLTADAYMRHMHPRKTEDELEPEECELLAAIRTYEGLPKLERDLEALLAPLPPVVAFRLAQSPTCLSFLRNGIPLTEDAYMRHMHPGKTKDQLEGEESALVSAIGTYEILPKLVNFSMGEQPTDEEMERAVAIAYGRSQG